VAELRVRERVNGGMYLFGLALAALGAGYAFLRVDAWSKGYLTLWLLAAAATAVVGAGLLFFGVID
jgi:hypothetical protein